jgi:hypothetical protein
MFCNSVGKLVWRETKVAFALAFNRGFVARGKSVGKTSGGAGQIEGRCQCCGNATRATVETPTAIASDNPKADQSNVNPTNMLADPALARLVLEYLQEDSKTMATDRGPAA